MSAMCLVLFRDYNPIQMEATVSHKIYLCRLIDIMYIDTIP
jgi:hypothetical protein